MDAATLGWIAAHRTPWLDGVMWALTAAGSTGAVWIVTAVVMGLVDRRRRMAAWQVGLAVLLAWAVSDGVLKPVVQRARPDASLQAAVLGHAPSGSSFPSGHASSSAAGALMLSAVLPAARVAFWALAVGISLSRVYLGVHYPTDILAGFVIGILVALFVRGGTVWRFGADRGGS